jgi:HSP20 family protein
MEKRRHRQVFFFPATQAGGQTIWRPSVDVYRIPDGWLLKFDLAGVRMEDVTVTAEGCRITVSGVRRDWLVDEGASYYSMEIAYNKFERSVELPCHFRNPHIALEGRDGLLIIRVTEA